MVDLEAARKLADAWESVIDHAGVDDLPLDAFSEMEVDRTVGTIRALVDALEIALAEVKQQTRAADHEAKRAERAEAERDTWRNYSQACVKEAAKVKKCILDIDAHATPHGDIPDEPGWVGTYLVTAGSLHRALGKVGHSAPSCEAEAELARLRMSARSESCDCNVCVALVPVDPNE